MPIGIVDRFEVIHVEHEEAHGRMRAQGALDFSAQQVEQSAAVRQAGEHVVGSLIAELFLGNEKIVLQRENFGEGLALRLMGGLGLQAQHVCFLELGADDAGLCADASAQADVPRNEHHHYRGENAGKNQGVTRRPPGRALQDQDLIRGLQQDFQRLRRFAGSDLD